MTITIELKPETEKRVRKAALSSGMQTQEFVQHYLNLQFPIETSEPHISARETELLQQLELDIPEATWRRYRKLCEKLRAEQWSVTGEKYLAAGEYEELMALTHEVEAANVERVKRLIELSQIRHTSVPELMVQLGIKTPEPE